MILNVERCFKGNRIATMKVYSIVVVLWDAKNMLSESEIMKA